MPGDLDLSSRVHATDLAVTATEMEALARLQEVCEATDGPMERHGLRCFAICDRLASISGASVDREVMFIAGLLHDIGLYDGASRGGAYVSDGKEFAGEILSGRDGWGADRIRLCLDAIERHHELRSQWTAGMEVEFLRRADLVDLSRGVANFGLDRGWLDELWKAVPRDGTYREIGAMVLKAVRERPTSLPKIFLRGSG